MILSDNFPESNYIIFYEGAIELSILAEYYGREIAAYDIQTTRCDLYGQVSYCTFMSTILRQIVEFILNVLYNGYFLTGEELSGKSHADI